MDELHHGKLFSQHQLVQLGRSFSPFPEASLSHCPAPGLATPCPAPHPAFPQQEGRKKPEELMPLIQVQPIPG